MKARNVKTIGAAIKLGIFTVISIFVTGLLAAIMGNYGFGSQKEYTAIFENASMIEKGDDVRIAGLSVGEVRDVEIHQRNQAKVTFRIKSDVPLTNHSGAEVRFLNLVGDRYMALTEGDTGGTPLDEGGTIPMARTTPSLNLTELFNGFQPLFQALTPAEVNSLSLNLIKVLQGEGGTVQGILRHTASLTNDLADRDELVGDVVTNLSSMLKTVDDRHQQLNDLVLELRDWMGNLSKDRKAIGASLGNMSELTNELAVLLTQSRPWLKQDIAELRRIMELLNKPANQAVLDETLTRLPQLLERQTRIGTYGSWYNYYLCDFKADIILPSLGQLDDVPGLKQLRESLKGIEYYSTAERCDA